MAGRIIWTAPRLISAPPPEQHIVRWMSQLLSPGGTFFDVGAHYGWISMLAAHCVGRSGRVVAFEPSPVLADILSYHKRVNRMQHVELVSKAVSDINAKHVPFFLVNGGLSFRNSLTIGADVTAYVSTSEKTRHEVDAITLDRFVESTGSTPHVIKIDVEGAELLVLRGAEQLLRRFRPHLIVGVHPYWLPRSQTVGEIFDLLRRRHGYQVKDRHVVLFEGGYVADYLCAPG
jgi:FkbM family methyltransferase